MRRRVSSSSLRSLAKELHPDIAEAVEPMPGQRDLSFYIVLCLVIIPLWSIPPLSWAYVFYALCYANVFFLSWFRRALFVAAVCEVFFSIYHYNISRFIHHYRTHAHRNPTETIAAFKLSLKVGLSKYDEINAFDKEATTTQVFTPLAYDDPRAVDYRNRIRTWYSKVPWSAIRKDEVYSWLCWCTFSKHFTSLDALSDDERTTLIEALRLLEYRAGSTIPDGSNPAVKTVRLTFDPVDTIWRPLVWYIAVAASNAWVRWMLSRRWGVTFRSYSGLTYLLRLPATWDPKTGPRPLVFLHGLGLGLTQYQRSIVQLFASLPEHPVLIPMQPYISQELFHPRFLCPMNREEMTKTLARLLEELGWAECVENQLDLEERGMVAEENAGAGDVDLSAGVGGESAGAKARKRKVPMGVTMLSHSNGSFEHSWMLKSYPSMITRSCIVDPVAFCLWEGDLCYNWVHRPCSTGIHLVIKYFVAGELGVANLQQRHFDWTSNSLWVEDIPNARDPRRTMFFLGGKDDIIPADRVKKYLTSHGIRKNLWYDANGRHGEAMLAGGRGLQEILRWLQQPDPTS